MNNLKAYEIRNNISNECIIVWAENSGKAKSKALYNEIFSFSDFTDLKAIRIKEFDKYSETKKIPISELLKSGWWFMCYKCNNKQISQDDIDNGEAFIFDNDIRNDFVKGTVICADCRKKLKRTK